MDDAAAFALTPGRNCWRIEHAERFAVLVDGEAYFAAVRQALIAARRRVDILAWDIDSRVELVRGERADDDRLPRALGELLIALLERNPDLEVRILLWDYAPIYALEREPLFFGTAPWRRHPRLRFIKDSAHPLAASQHQKLVLVDERIAFCAGLDLSKWRWDSSTHHVEDPRRRDPNGDPYPPYHDLAVLVDGAAAAALVGLFAERWRRAGGTATDALPAYGSDPWPETVAVTLRHQPVAIARTLPHLADRAEVRESERLYLDIIGAARSLLYIENQYLTSRAVGDALCRSLGRPQGPDIIIVLPRETGHWLEQHTMDVLRARLLERLRAADRHRRLRTYYPEAGGGVAMMVHAKLMIADDRILRIGSSNLSNRAMGLDSECDLCILAERETQSRAIAELRRRLLAMLLSQTPAAVAAAEARPGHGPIAAVEALRAAPPHAEGTLRLAELEGRSMPEWERQLPDERLIDPDRPLDPELLADVVAGEAGGTAGIRRRLWTIGGVLALFLALAAAWRFSPLGDWFEPKALAGAAAGLSQAAWGPPAALAGFTVLALVAVPVTFLILVTALVFGPTTGALIALAGSTLSALAGYGLGRISGRQLVESLAGGRLERLSRRLASRGILTVVTLRVVPVAPFAVLNLLAGASHLRLRDFLIGTLIGMAPAVVAMAVFAEGLLSLLGRADLRALGLLIAGLLGLGGVAWLGRRLFVRADV